MNIVGYNVEGFEVIEAEYTSPNAGYALGRCGDQYATWFFRTPDGQHPIFQFGKDFPASGPCAREEAHADYHDRLCLWYSSHLCIDRSSNAYWEFHNRMANSFHYQVERMKENHHG